MKKSIFFVLMAVLFALSSCEQPSAVVIDPQASDSTYSAFSSATDLAGLWIRVDTPKLGTCSYELTESKFTYRPSHSGYIEDTIFVCTSHDNWEKVSSSSYNYSFDVETQSIHVFFLGSVATITRLGKDSARLVSDYFDWDCQLKRVRGVRIENQ